MGAVESMAETDANIELRRQTVASWIQSTLRPVRTLLQHGEL